MYTAPSCRPLHALNATSGKNSMKLTNASEIFAPTEHSECNEKPLSILISIGNIASIQAALNTAQGNSRPYILSAADIIGLAENAERELERAEIAPSFRKGAIYTVVPKGYAKNEYRRSRRGMIVVLERNKSAWALIEVHLINLWPTDKGRQTLTLTMDQKLRALRRLMKNLHISAPDIAYVLRLTSNTD